MDYVLIAEFIKSTKCRLGVIAFQRYELNNKTYWTKEDEELAGILDEERDILEEELEEAQDALSQCD